MSDKEQMYLEVYSILFDSNWFKMARLMFRVMGHMESILMSYLMNHAERVNKKKHKFPMMHEFFCKSSTVEKSINFSPQMTKRYMKRLAELGLISLSKDQKTRRVVLINFEKLIAELHRAVREWE